jgi:hypothetical protein
MIKCPTHKLKISDAHKHKALRKHLSWSPPRKQIEIINGMPVLNGMGDIEMTI